MFEQARNDEDLKMQIFGNLRCRDIQWLEKEENPVLSKSDVFQIVTKIAVTYCLEPALVLAVIKAESNLILSVFPEQVLRG